MPKNDDLSKLYNNKPFAIWDTGPPKPSTKEESSKPALRIGVATKNWTKVTLLEIAFKRYFEPKYKVVVTPFDTEVKLIKRGEWFPSQAIHLGKHDMISQGLAERMMNMIQTCINRKIPLDILVAFQDGIVVEDQENEKAYGCCYVTCANIDRDTRGLGALRVNRKTKRANIPYKYVQKSIEKNLQRCVGRFVADEFPEIPHDNWARKFNDFNQEEDLFRVLDGMAKEAFLIYCYDETDNKSK